MDIQCVSVLPRVCEVLAASGSSLPDDTSLEKLLDWFTATTNTGVSLLESAPCLLDFISNVAFSSTSGPGILSFTLKLTGLIAASEDGFKALEECSVLKLIFDPHHWKEAGLWEDPCLRIGWIQGLRKMLQHSKALRLFVQADLIEPLLQLQTDSSLFVSSAANQLLAHVLLLYQSLSSAGCNGANKRDLEHSGVSEQTIISCSGIITNVSEYLKKSLVLKESSHPPQSQQILKLLTLLLVQLRPPLQEQLLLTVIDSLEELVTKRWSLPLMDVILAANSLQDDCVSKQQIVRLLSIMLYMKKPADVIQVAAAFLRSRQHDPTHAAYAAGVLLLPLDIATGISLLKTNSTGVDLRILMTEQLKSKSCISMICVCLTNIPQITVMAPDCLPCPQRLIVAAVLTFLRLCRGDSSSSSTACVEVSRFVTGSSKVQKCAMEALSELSKSPEAEALLADVFKLLTEYLNSPDSDPTVLQKSYKALINWIGVCRDFSSITDQLREGLMQAVRKRACDIRWEARDSTVEFLGHLAEVCPIGEEREPLKTLLGSCSFTIPLLKEALQDPESYVRASSIATLAQTLTFSWQQGAALTQEQEEIVTQLQEILSQDSEGFARRAVVKFFTAWFSSCPSPTSCSLLMQSVPSVLSQGVADLDWEVKLHTLELAELLLDKTFPERLPLHPYAVISNQPHTCHAGENESDLLCSLNSLVDQGVVPALLCGLVDCDRPVALKACQLLIKLRDTVSSLLVNAADPRVSCMLPGQSWVQEMRGNKDAHTQGAPHVGSESRDEAAEETPCTDGDAVCVSVCEVLRTLDLDKKLSVLMQSSDHIYNSPLSLLQDILTASTAASNPNSDPGQEVIVDCY
ncbi:PREDICTED: BRCA1-associated ATM activator 1 isoform X2 [Cyprinodon variegatus]|uniref:BRCA1-associated ATM activator 1 isoform X2 n=1 Tax=Cyprinodon variegatus TaxID=28743 RepID=UPI0007426A58|nr:PREDICTED: BRCA1-associated ATM activator 1 isoform X2 [Cyprinodon variegatus]